MSEIILSKLNSKITELENHPLYSQITCLDSLRFFMERHVFAVFDFMSLTKGLQGYFAPINKIWTPPKNRELARFINEIVLGEESDVTPDGHYMSHFELYILAMNEVKANPTKVLHLADNILTTPLAKIDNEISIPKSALNFMNDTFGFIEEGSIHKIASAFCFGREKVIPKIFTALLQKMNITQQMAPHFHYYLQRHIEVDGGEHGPLAMKMMQILCGNDEQKWFEVEQAALFALNSRITFWDQVLREK